MKLAEFDSECTACGEPIFIGDEIEEDGDNCWVHYQCAELSVVDGQEPLPI